MTGSDASSGHGEQHDEQQDTETTMSNSDTQTDSDGEQSNPDCEMPECVGSPDDETKAARDEGDLIEICDSCLSRWDGFVEPVEQ